MESFAVHCTTCRARLVVRDPAAIGQILACPRCASMVLVEAPPGYVAPPRPAAPQGSQVVRPRGAPRSPAADDVLGVADTVPDSLAGLDDILAGRPATSATRAGGDNASSANTPATNPSAAKPASANAAAAQAAATSSPATPTSSANPPPLITRNKLHGDAAPSMPLPDDSSGERVPEAIPDVGPMAQVARWSPTHIVLAAGALGIVLAVSAALLLIVGFGRKPVDVASGEHAAGDSQGHDNASDDSDSTDPQRDPASDDAEGASNDKNATEGGTSGIEGATDSKGPKSKNNDAAGAPGRGEAGEPSKPGEKPGSQKTADDQKPSTDPVEPTNAKPQDNTKTKPRSPEGGELEFQPKPTDIRRPLPAIGGKFADVLNNAPLDLPARPGAIGEPTEKPGSPASETAGKPDDAGEPRASLPRPLAREIDVSARLADRLASVAYQEVPLVDFINEVSDLSTIPITVDLEALRLRRLSIATPVTAKLENCTVKELLAASLSPLQLQARIEGEGDLLVTLAESEEGSSKVDYAVEDLTGGEESRAESLAQQIKLLVAPGAWVEEGGTATLETAAGKLTIEGPVRVHLETQLLLDKFRVARKLSPRAKPAFTLAAVSPDTAAKRAADKLATTLKLNFGRPTRLTAILQRLGRDTGTRIVPDWIDLVSIGWTTETQATVTVEGKSLAETLTTLLEPMELAYRVVDETTIEVVARKSVAGRTTVEFHSTTDVVAEDAETLLRRLETELGAEQFSGQGGPAKLFYDAPSQCVVAAGSHALQCRIAQTLTSWKKTK